MPRKQTTALLVFIGVLILGGCPDGPITAQWSRSNQRPLTTPLLPVEEAWLVKLPAPPSAGGAIDADRVYVPLQVSADDAASPGLVALDRESGSILWTSELRSTWPPVMGGDLLFVSVESEVHALDPITGRVKWQATLMGTPTSPMVFTGASLLVAIEPAAITAIRASDGEAMWLRPLDATTQVTPAFGERNMAYLSLTNSRVIGVSLATGETKWERELSGRLSPPAVTRDRVFVGNTDNVFYALHSDSGDTAWQWRTGGDVIGSVADTDGVYFTALDNIIRRVNRTNGNQQWKKPITTRPVSPPRLAGGTVVVAGLAPALSEFDARTGAPTSTYTAPGNPPGDLQGAPLVDPVLRPFRVAVVVLLRDGRAVGLRPVSMMFREQPLEPLSALPGRGLVRERLP